MDAWDWLLVVGASACIAAGGYLWLYYLAVAR